MTSTVVAPSAEQTAAATRPRKSAPHRRAIVELSVAGGFLVALVLVSLFVPMPVSPTRPDPRAVLQPPSSGHWLGTDRSGLDVFSRIIRAAHLDILIGVTGASIGMVIGSAFGLIASTKSRLSELFMRGVDVMQAFPLLILMLAVIALTGGGVAVMIGCVAMVNVPRFIRLVRAQALTVRESNFVTYAAVIGVPRRTVLLRHILRNVTGVIFVQLSLGAASAVSVIAAISFLGAGIEPPTPTWGSMIQSGASVISTGQWWPLLFPAIALVVVIVCFNVVADALEALISRGH